MKKTILINASPSKNGFTRQITDAFFSGYNDDLHIYNMYNEQFAPCIGCGKCESNHKCFISDMDNILEDIFTADHIVFATPVYNYSVPSPMKAFLDRLQPYFSSEKTKIVRKGFLLASCGKSGKFSIDVVEKQCKMAFSELSAEFCGSYFFINTDKIKTLQQDEICKVKKLAKDFFYQSFFTV